MANRQNSVGGRKFELTIKQGEKVVVYELDNEKWRDKSSRLSAKKGKYEDSEDSKEDHKLSKDEIITESDLRKLEDLKQKLADKRSEQSELETKFNQLMLRKKIHMLEFCKKSEEFEQLKTK